MVNDNVTSLARRLGSNDALGGHDLSGEGRLILVNIHGHGRLIPVRAGLQEVLRFLARCELNHSCSGSDDARTRREELLGVVNRLNDLDDFHGLFGGEGRRGEASGGECDGGEDSGGSREGLSKFSSVKANHSPLIEKVQMQTYLQSTLAFRTSFICCHAERSRGSMVRSVRNTENE